MSCSCLPAPLVGAPTSAMWCTADMTEVFSAKIVECWRYCADFILHTFCTRHTLMLRVPTRRLYEQLRKCLKTFKPVGNLRAFAGEVPNDFHEFQLSHCATPEMTVATDGAISPDNVFNAKGGGNSCLLFFLPKPLGV